jgi:hypothetical protein
MSKDKAKVALEKVTLLDAHTHKGVKCKAGDSIDVNQVQKNWLIEQKKIEQPKSAS